jgi:NDP-sugar pyrophosphorylase family protein
MRAVILAGGKGTRLAPYTMVLPKPLMPIGDIPILEVVLRQLRRCGLTDVTLAVGHLAELLMAYFNDGSRCGVKITYVREEAPLGTAGPLAQIPGLDETFLVMNGDVLTDLDYKELIQHHKQQKAVVTIAMHRREVFIDLGVMETNAEGRLVRYIEKPTYEFRVSMGIYVFEPRIKDYIESNSRLDFPELIQRLLDHGETVVGHSYPGYWLDIGRPDDYAEAVAEFTRRRDAFLKED